MIPHPPIGLYIHIPFCLKKCPYCDFNSYAVEMFKNMEEEYTNALLSELNFYVRQEQWGNKLATSVFFGGGTPSLFSPASIEKILSAIHSSFALANNAEITLECNPGTIGEELGREKLIGFRSAGINRISMGAQSFSPRKLEFLGRIHSFHDTVRAVENIKAAGYVNFNLDLMSGTKDESISEWEKDLDSALALDAPHLSCYGLTIEPGTEFHTHQRRGAVLTADEELQATFYRLTQEKLQNAGYFQYEISNYARPHHTCLHNLTYWKGRSYLGLGAGAHSFSGRENPSSWGKRWSNERAPKRYCERVLAGDHARTFEEALTSDQAEMEFFLLGLRLQEGIDTLKYKSLFGRSFEADHAQTVNRLLEEDLLLVEEENISLSKRGFLFSDYVLKSFSERV